jgi:guanylate kinase
MDLSEKLSSQIAELKNQWNGELAKILDSYRAEAGDEKKLEEESTRQFESEAPYQFTILSGPSGVGRSTIGKILKDKNVPGIRHYTTRSPRSEEEKQSGIYVYVSQEEFNKMQEEGAFLQDAETYGDWRGITKEEVLNLIKAGQKFYIDKSVWTTKKLLEKKEMKESHHVRIFILPPSFDELVRRLLGRSEQDQSNIDEEKVLDRLQKSVDALKESFGIYHVYLVNDNLEAVAKKILNYL